MPIEQSRMVALLLAAEDALGGLDHMHGILQREMEVMQSGGIDADGVLRNLSLLLFPDALLDAPLTTRMTIAREHEKLTPRKQKEAKRKREYQRKRRGAEEPEGDDGIEDDKEIEI